jgi:hypothetical protein
MVHISKHVKSNYQNRKHNFLPHWCSIICRKTPTFEWMQLLSSQSRSHHVSHIYSSLMCYPTNCQGVAPEPGLRSPAFSLLKSRRDFSLELIGPLDLGGVWFRSMMKSSGSIPLLGCLVEMELSGVEGFHKREYSLQIWNQLTQKNSQSHRLMFLLSPPVVPFSIVYPGLFGIITAPTLHF